MFPPHSPSVPFSPSDLFLSQDLTEEQAQRYLGSLGFRDPAAADEHLRVMADDVVVRQALGAMADVLLGALLRSPDPDAALVGFSRYLGARSAKTMFLEYLRDDPPALQVLAEVLGTSPLLAEILIRNPEYFHWLVSETDRRAPGALEDDEETEAVPASLENAASVLDVLKRLKRRQILRIAARDILGRESLSSVTAQLSSLASLLTSRALDAVTARLVADEGLSRPPGTFAVIGMGKLGGSELNYSSDIDLIYVYDLDDEDDRGAHDFYYRLARRLTAALGEHTEESYLYRVDLRLRPMGRRGNVAYSLRQCRQYYETWGETFERFALIKSRPIAGDPVLGQRFVDLVQPFVYRRYLDHAALEEMYQYKARLDRTFQDRDSDRNVKVGRGGIREVELFTQVLQLTYGAQQPDIRQANTLVALGALGEAGLIPGTVCDELTRAYTFLRTVEHRLQIVQGSQTHSLSHTPAELVTTARRLGFKAVEELEAKLRVHRQRVHAVYSGLFERRQGTSSFKSRQFFRILSEGVSEEEALVSLAEYDLVEPKTALHVIQSLAQRASLTDAPSTARNVLANLLALWMETVAHSARPEQVLNRFERLTGQVGATTLLYRSLLENEGLRNVLVDVLETGDLMAQRLVRYPELLDSLLLPSPGIDSLRDSFAAVLDRMEGLERLDRLNQIRRFKLVEEFKTLVGWLADGSCDILQGKLSLLADCCVERAALWHAAGLSEPDRPDAGVAIVALGKLGGQELTVHSDLDLVVLYQGDPADSARFVRHQSFVEQMQAFLQEPTSEGVAYRVDTRLRPEGTKGALAIPLASFRAYLDTRAEVWERLAWTRSRVVVGSRRMIEEIEDAVTRFVYGPWDARIPHDMHDIRMRMERELAREGETRLDFKVGRGGLADVDFLLQLVQIREGWQRPEFRVSGTRRLLATLPPTSYVKVDELEQLRQAHTFLWKVELFARLEADSNVTWIAQDPAGLDALGRRLGLGRRCGEQVLRRYRETTEQVRSIYTAVLARL